MRLPSRTSSSASATTSVSDDAVGGIGWARFAEPFPREGGRVLGGRAQLADQGEGDAAEPSRVVEDGQHERTEIGDVDAGQVSVVDGVGQNDRALGVAFELEGRQGVPVLTVRAQWTNATGAPAARRSLSTAYLPSQCGTAGRRR
jgi:hypothetical protein